MFEGPRVLWVHHHHHHIHTNRWYYTDNFIRDTIKKVTALQGKIHIGKWMKRFFKWKYETPHDKTNKMACASSEDLDQPGHPPSLIRVFAVRMKKAWVPSYPLSAQRRLWSDWADAQADLSLRWAHTHFIGFVMSWLKYVKCEENR